jgi:hypothetical protein
MAARLLLVTMLANGNKTCLAALTSILYGCMLAISVLFDFKKES